MQEQLNDRLKALMKARGLNQKRLAEKSGLSEAAVSKYLSGSRTPHLTILVSLAKALGTTSDYLLGVESQSGNDAFEQILEAVKRNKSQFSMEQKIKLIQTLSL